MEAKTYDVIWVLSGQEELLVELDLDPCQVAVAMMDNGAKGECAKLDITRRAQAELHRVYPQIKHLPVRFTELKINPIPWMLGNK